MTSKVLAIDTATEQCSVALLCADKLYERVVPTARGHADMILSLIDAILQESAEDLSSIDALAFGRGPGSFTGVRIAVGVVQGLSYARRLPVIGVSNLAAVALRAANEQSLAAGTRVLVCMDARMQETYWATYEVGELENIMLIGKERVAPPTQVETERTRLAFVAGTAWRAYPELRSSFSDFPCDDSLLPRAREIAVLAQHKLNAGDVFKPGFAEPVYLRDQVAWPQQNS